MPRSMKQRHPARQGMVTVRLTEHEAHYLIGGLVLENNRMERARHGSSVRYEYDEDIHKANEEVKEKLVRASRRSL